MSLEHSIEHDQPFRVFVHDGPIVLPWPCRSIGYVNQGNVEHVDQKGCQHQVVAIAQPCPPSRCPTILPLLVGHDVDAYVLHVLNGPRYAGTRTKQTCKEKYIESRLIRKETQALTCQSIPQVQALNARYGFNGRHHSVDYGKDGSNEAEDHGYGDGQYGEQPQAKSHQVRIAQHFLFHCSTRKNERTNKKDE